MIGQTLRLDRGIQEARGEPLVVGLTGGPTHGQHLAGGGVGRQKLNLGFLRSSHKGLVSAKVRVSARGF